VSDSIYNNWGGYPGGWTNTIFWTTTDTYEWVPGEFTTSDSDRNFTITDATGYWKLIDTDTQYSSEYSSEGPSWLGSFFSDLFSVSSAKQAQSDAWKKGYYSCLAKEAAGGAKAPVVTHTIGMAATYIAEHGAPTLAGAYYHFTDGRFTAWGKSSKVLVPKLAPKIATLAKALDVAGWAYFDYELARAVGACSAMLQ
jgi:hypothetical protein